MSEITESEERLARPLIRLAKLVGVGTSYLGMSHDYHEIDDDVLIEVLAALGIDASSESAQLIAIRRILNERYARLVAPTVLHIAGSEDRVLVNTGILDVPSASITLENGEPYQGTIEVGPGDGSQAYDLDGTFISNAAVVIPADLPIGYHTLHVKVADRVQDATLISAPDRVDLLDPMKGGSLWGWMAQLYSIRSSNSWGVGDYEDLKTMLVDAKEKTGADFVLINPVHAAEPVSPLTPSPYLPVSRRLINFTYIRPEAIAEYATLSEGDKNAVDGLHADTEPLNGDSQLIDRDAMWRSKMHACGLSSRPAVPPNAKAYSTNSRRTVVPTWRRMPRGACATTSGGRPTARRATGSASSIATPRKSPICASSTRTLWTSTAGWNGLPPSSCPPPNRQPRTPACISASCPIWPSACTPPALTCGGIPSASPREPRSGAPPDMFNQQGQNWSQPPLSPINLETTGYEAYRNMVHGMFARAGAVRIDHILGLFRLWWIPENRSAMDGAYVYYDSDIMLGVLAIEASRAGGVVVGEDLGVVPDHVADSLSSHGILGCAVEWFEQCDGVFRAPSQWRPYALASVNTHDLPPAAGYLEYEHVKIRERLGLLTGPAEEFEASAKAEQDAMLAMLVEQGYLDADFAEHREDHEADIVDALYHALKGSPCKLLAASITDAVGEKRAQNQPGTNNEYPNWRIPLADAKGNVVPLETLFDTPGAQRFAQIFNS